uniref:RING-type E3 ubiquitin transferase n=1 Tax=Caligus rogercresseyi TaxID=217165 RepID=C1BNP3_CALRO|nr:E3 ubiquitin-protein ligase SIAH1B [Caligus rogercresseyi]
MDIMDLDLGSVSNTSILSLLECPVCLDHITPPIKQCVKGHLVCIDCFPRLHHCPTCRSNMCDERNLAIEQVSRLLHYPCRYHPMGCKQAFPLSKKGTHEKDCTYLQLKCPIHGQCAFNGSLSEVVPHLAANHAVNPVPVQPTGLLFYRAKHFNRRNLWNLIYSWDNNLFRFIVKHIHADIVGRTENCNLLIAHIQYVGPESMAARYAYGISLFDAEKRQTGRKFDGLVSSTLKALESQCAKDDIFVTTFHRARDYTDKWGNLNFIIQMRKIVDEGHTEESSRRSGECPVISLPPTAAIPS